MKQKKRILVLDHGVIGQLAPHLWASETQRTTGKFSTLQRGHHHHTKWMLSNWTHRTLLMLGVEVSSPGGGGSGKNMVVTQGNQTEGGAS